MIFVYFSVKSSSTSNTEPGKLDVGALKIKVEPVDIDDVEMGENCGGDFGDF